MIGLPFVVGPYASVGPRDPTGPGHQGEFGYYFNSFP